MTTDAAFAAALPGAMPAVLREVRPPQAPWPGVLVTDADGLGVLVEADVVAASFAYWDDLDGHVAVPREILLSSDRVHVVMPASALSLHSLLRRWEDDPPPLGELVTAAVSVLRGAGQDRGDALAGSWWLCDDGRPLFFPGSDATMLPEASAVALNAMSEVAGSAEASALLLRIAQEVRGAEPGRFWTQEWEDAVFALAPASAISTAPRAQSHAMRGSFSPPTRAARRTDSARVARPAPHRPVGRIVAAVQRVSGAVRAVLPGGRRRRWALVVAAGAVVLLAGVLWPTPNPPEASSLPPTDSSGIVAATEQAAPPAAGPADEAGVEIVRALVRGVQNCPDAACRMGFWETAEVVPPSDLPDPDESVLELVDDLGGVMVVRTRPPDGASAQVLVIVQVDDGRWRLRDARPLTPAP